jgi:tight adherence protein C
VSSRAALLLLLPLWLGATLVLAEIRWFRHVPLADRLGPYAPAGVSRRRSSRGVMSIDAMREVIAPLARSLGARTSELLGVEEDLSMRLARIHSRTDPGSFRVRQLGWAVAALALGATVAMSTGASPLFTALLVIGTPVLAFLVPEQQLSTAGARWQRRVFLELPVVTEQLGMLLSSGYSLGAGLNRLADRGRGACGQDLRRVCARIRYGSTEIDALHEWGQISGVPAVERLVGVLALNREAGDLGRLISDEARSIRRDAQRELMETIEKKAQLVWVPVTVAALLPGTLFIVVPFVEAMRLFTAP